MRDEKRNNKLLSKMRIYIAEWEARKPTPAGNKFMFVWLVMFVGAAAPTLMFCPSLWVLGCMISWFFLSQRICRRIIPHYNESWVEVFDRMLSAYEPLNLHAWEHLKRQAETESLSVSNVSRWYQEEVMSVWPEKKTDLKFLHNNPDRETEPRRE